MPKVSVIIPSYNSANYLPQAIESVISQTMQDFEIILVNDGSTDHTAEVVKRYLGYLRYVEQENYGPASARNKGILLAKGEYLAFLDADDLYLPDKLEIQSRYLDLYPDIDLVYSDGIRFKQRRDGREILMRMSVTGEVFTDILQPEDFVNRLIPRNGLQINLAMVRQNCVVSIGGFDENLSAFEDWDLCFRLSIRCRFAYLEGVVAKHRIRDGSLSTDMILNNMECENVMEKISLTESFRSAPKVILAKYYYNRGVLALALRRAKAAKKYFMRSIELQPGGNNAHLALFLARMFGKRAFFFYHVKRQLFGIRGIKRI